jgi:hypothetical protein
MEGSRSMRQAELPLGSPKDRWKNVRTKRTKRTKLLAPSNAVLLSSWMRLSGV